MLVYVSYFVCWWRQVHEAVIAAGKTRSGCTVHQVTEEVDSGPIVVQEEVEVVDGETPDSLKAKVHTPSCHSARRSGFAFVSQPACVARCLNQPTSWPRLGPTFAEA